MKLYLDCSMGASGDMLMAALIELLPDRELFLERMRSLGLPGVEITCEPVKKLGISGTKVHVRINGVEEKCSEDVPGVEPDLHGKADNAHPRSHGEDSHEHGHAHYSYSDVCEIISGLDLAENVKEDALDVYRLIAEAEAAVHGVSLENVRFHELGSLDAVADVVGCSLLFHMIGADTVEASPVHVGSGFVRCEHGLLPVPAPATAHILRGVPIYGGPVRGELCTPTGAAILRHFVSRFGDLEPIAVARIGYGMGSKDYEAPNCVRAFLSEQSGPDRAVTEIVCNLDDMTPEAVGYVTELLLKSGALDVFTVPVYMKKNRPGVMLTCICRPGDTREMTRLILENTTTFGVRYRDLRREVLDREVRAVSTPYGEIRVKFSRGFGVSKIKPEYEDVRAAAALRGASFGEVYLAALEAAGDFFPQL